MVNIHFNDWRKNLTKKDKERIHEKNIFELIFSRKATELGLKLGEYELINIFCLGNERSPTSIEKLSDLNQIQMKIPYNFQEFLSLNSTKEKFIEFRRLVYLYVLPILLDISSLPKDELLKLVDSSLAQIPAQNYEAIFLVGKTPKKSPSRKKVAILKGIHRVEGFQLYCEVYDANGIQIINKLIAEEVGEEGVYSRFLGELKWQDESSIIVNSRYSSWKASIEI